MKKLLFTLALVLMASSARASVISDGGLVVDIRDDNGAIGSATFNGIEFYQRGTFVSDYGFQLGSDTGSFAINTAYGDAGVIANVSSGANMVTVSGVYSGIQFSRVYTVSGGNTLHIDTVLTNLSGMSQTVLAFDSADPDQGIDHGASFDTKNDIDGLVASAQNVSRVEWNNPGSGILSFTPGTLGIFDGDGLNSVVAAPYDPNGASEDIGMAIVFQLNLAPGGTASFGYQQVFSSVQAVPEPASLAVFGVLIPVGAYLARRRKTA